ncbi:MAG: DUF885 domain-containing protein [Chloroflexota bacterium]
MTRKIMWIMLLLVCVLLAGCQSNDTVTTVTEAAPSTATAVSPSPSAATVTPVEPVVVQETAVPDPYPAITAIVTSLQGLPLPEFFEQSYRALLLRNPQAITEAGLVNLWQTDNNRLTDISDDYIRETQALEQAILNLLHSYDRAALPADQQLSYDIYEWYLQDTVAGHAFMYNDYPVNHFIISVHQDTIQFFTDIHPIITHQDVEDYITRLGQVETKFTQLIDGLQRREAAGVVPPKFILQWTLSDVRRTANSSARNTPFYTALADKLLLMSNITPDEQKELLAAAEQEITASVIPAFQALADYLSYQLTIATDDDGVWKFPNGAAYYAYTLRHYSTTDLTADEIHELGLQEVARVQADLNGLFAELGYPADESLTKSMQRVAQESGTLYGDEILAGYESLIAEAEANVGAAFDLRPQAKVIVIGVPYGGYYVRPAVDGSRPGAFYATQQGSEAVYGMATLAYHEAVPGHHFQLAIMQELTNLPSFRQGISFTAYTEGWALYAERLAYELGFYEDDPYGNIGRLQAELFRAVRLVVDTGIHTQGWTFDEAVTYMMENTGYSRGMVEGQISRYIVWPGQAVSYEIGMMKILELRQRAQDALGEAFDLRAFHNVVLQNGMPLTIFGAGC